MLNDKDLHDVYDGGAQTNHMTGLRAVWARAVAWANERIAATEAAQTPAPAEPTNPSGVPDKPNGWV